MTVVVGFNWPVEHDHAVAVIVDGELVFATEEERWTRHKHSPGEPPINALRQALKYLREVRNKAERSRRVRRKRQPKTISNQHQAWVLPRYSQLISG